MWYRIGARFHVSVPRLKNETTATGFFHYQEFLDRELQETERLESYLARLTWEVYQFRRVFNDQLPAATPEEFVIKFSRGKSGPQKTPEEIEKQEKEAGEKRVQKSKTAWGAFGRLKKAGQTPPPKPDVKPKPKSAVPPKWVSSMKKG